MITFSKQQKVEAYTKLTPAEQSAAFSEPIVEKIKSIASKYNLNNEDAQRLQFSIGLVILKLITEKDLLQVLVERLPSQPIGNILNDINTIIFPEVERVIREYKPEPEEVDDEEGGGEDETTNKESSRGEIEESKEEKPVEERWVRPSVIDYDKTVPPELKIPTPAAPEPVVNKPTPPREVPIKKVVDDPFAIYNRPVTQPTSVPVGTKPVEVPKVPVVSVPKPPVQSPVAPKPPAVASQPATPKPIPAPIQQKPVQPAPQIQKPIPPVAKPAPSVAPKAPDAVPMTAEAKAKMSSVNQTLGALIRAAQEQKKAAMETAPAPSMGDQRNVIPNIAPKAATPPPKPVAPVQPKPAPVEQKPVAPKLVEPPVPTPTPAPQKTNPAPVETMASKPLFQAVTGKPSLPAMIVPKNFDTKTPTEQQMNATILTKKETKVFTDDEPVAPIQTPVVRLTKPSGITATSAPSLPPTVSQGKDPYREPFE